MQVSVETPNKLERKMTVSVPFERVDAAFDKRILSLSKTAKVNGYRPGKVPVDVIRQRFGDSIRKEALSEVIQSSLYDAMSQEKLKPVGAPVVQPKSILPGQPLEYVATFEVMPHLESVAFNIKKIEKQIATVSDSDIERVIERLQQQHANWTNTERPAQLKDQTIIDFSGALDGKPFPNGQAHDYPIMLGSKMMIAGFEEGIIGMSAGEEKVLKLKFPDNYFSKEVAGKDVEFTVKLIKVLEAKLPELNEATVKKFGVKSGQLADLRDEIRKNLERELTRMIEQKLKMQIFNLLIEQNPVELPNALIDQEAKRIHDQMHPHHPGEEHHHSDAEMQQFRDSAKQHVMIGLLVGELVKQHNLSVSPERLDDYVSGLASAYENPDEVKEWYLKNRQQRATIEMLLLEEVVVQKLLEGKDIVEKTVTYNDLMAK